MGLFVALIGQDGMHAYDRFTFGWTISAAGSSLIPALVGAFGFAEMLTMLADPPRRRILNAVDSVLPRYRETSCSTGARSCARA